MPKKDPDICPWPSTICAPEQIVAFVRDAEIAKVQNNVLPSECHNATNMEGELETKKNQQKSQVCLAKLVISENRITFVQQRGAFMVTGSTNKVYAVKLLPDSCQCGSTATCHHIMAARLVMGWDIHGTSKELKLMQLRKNIRTRADKKSGREKPRVLDYDPDTTVVEPAPDSAMASERPNLTSTPRQSLPKSPLLNISPVHVSASINITPTSDKLLESCLKKGRSSSKKVQFRLSNSGKRRRKLELSDENMPNMTNAVSHHDLFNSFPHVIEKELEGVLNELDISNVEQVKTHTKVKKQSPAKWVQNLDYFQKGIIENKLGTLNDHHIQAAHQILANQFKDINGFQCSTIAPTYDEKLEKWVNSAGENLESRCPPSVQIHHTGHFHWVMSCQMEKDGIVYIMDSLTKGELSTSLQIQIAAIYGFGRDKVNCIIPVINRQRNSVDCGLFAIANTAEFCFTKFKGIQTGKAQCIFEHDELRSHFIKCLEKGEMECFPKRNRLCPTSFTCHRVTVGIHCHCGYPDCVENLTACDNLSCENWSHMSCANITVVAKKKYIYCADCYNK